MNPNKVTREKLSQVACFSKFHFHRQFTEYMGITVSKFILISRLKQASYQLVYQSHLKIIAIALQANFEKPESFSRVFKKVLNQLGIYKHLLNFDKNRNGKIGTKSYC
ncbi:MAG: helix-turn-helix domain-containing protein [Methylococcales bacterium]